MFIPQATINRWVRQALFAVLVVAFACLGLLAHRPARAQAMTDYLETALINHILRGTAFAAPATIYVRLNTTACSDSASGTEVVGGAYARVAVVANTTNWTAPSGGNGQTGNANAITFPTPSAGWGTVVGFELMDAASGGNSLICQALTVSKTINSGDTVSFAPGALTVSLN